MKKLLVIPAVVILGFIVIQFLGIGTYPPIKGSVIDAKTGRTIAGAIIIVEWTKTHGFGEHWTESFKVEEAVTDKDGKFTVTGLNTRNVNQPDFTIYKKGYVAWNNKFIFPNYQKRTDFAWKDGQVFKLEQFLSSYSYLKHRSFIAGAANMGLADEKKKLFEKHYAEGENEEVQKEQREMDMSKGLRRPPRITPQPPPPPALLPRQEHNE